MIALGEQKTAVDFVVIQFANNVAIEDCQEVYLGSRAPNPPTEQKTGAVVVKLPSASAWAKL